MRRSAVLQRWVRPEIYNAPPGHCKLQLATKHLAVAAKGDVKSLRSLLREHPEFLSKRGSFGRTLLWEATRAGRVAAVKLLLHAGADVEATGAYNNETIVQITPLCAAVHYKRPDVEKLLRPLAAEPDVFRAAFLGDVARVARLLNRDPKLLNAEDPHDHTYFMPLIAFGVAGANAALVESLIERGAEVAPYVSQLLNQAARLNRIDILKLLIDHGAEIRYADAGISVLASDLATLTYLLDRGLSLKKTGLGRFPPLAFVARGDKGERPDKIAVLLERGAEVNAPGPDGRTALHYAATAGHLRVMELLLAHEADPRLRDDAGRTARELAEAAGKKAAANLLRGAGRKPPR